MADSGDTAAMAGRPISLAARLGWQHRGFQVDSRGKALLGLALLLLIPLLLDLSGALRFGLHRGYGDLRIWQRTVAGYVIQPDVPLYEQHPSYLYPPFFLTLITPLFELPDSYTAAVFQLLKWIALALSLLLAWSLCSPPREDLPPIVAVGSILLTARFFGNEIANGNINMFMLLAALLAAWLVARGWQFAAGFVISIAICIKVTPVLLLMYFVYKGWWRTLPGAVAGAAVCLLLWPGLVLGWEANWRELTAWYHHVLAGFLGKGAVYSVSTNQTFTALLNRFLGPHKTFEPDVYLALVVLPSWALNLIRMTLSLATLAVLAYACRRRVDPRRQPLAFALEVSLIQIAMLALTGYSWKAHFVAMLLPHVVLLAYLADARYTSRTRVWVKRCLLVSFALCTLTCDIITPTGADYTEAFGVFLFGALAAAVGLLVLGEALRGADGLPKAAFTPGRPVSPPDAGQSASSPTVS